MRFHDITGAVICGGQSKRFGSDKRLFKYKGNTFLDISFQKLNQICHKTLCVFRAPPPISLKNYPHIFDDFEIEGPMAGILSALNCSKSPYVFVLPCDVPHISIDFLKFFASLRSQEKIVILYTDRLEPLIGIYPKSIYKMLKAFSSLKNHSLKLFFHDLPVSKKVLVKLADVGNEKVTLSEFKNFNYGVRSFVDQYF
ncbi:MAG: molybdenum cofactor guanylyltransferase [Deltaproteobacteria bacterium]|nr:molybdenum cofactor guanylyltransferase [Deltaproteobacteria bacterium]